MSNLFTLQNIILDADERYANPFTQAQKIRWFNKIMRRHWKEFALDDTIIIPTIKDKTVYTLPAEVEFEMIDFLTVNSHEYKFRNTTDGKEYNCYYVLQDGQQGSESYFGIYPEPSEDNLDIRIRYWKRPEDVTEEDLGVVPDLREDYMDLFVYGLISIMAEIRQDVELSNNYKMNMMGVIQQMKQERFENMPQYPRTKATNPRSYRVPRTSRVAGERGRIPWLR